MSHWRTARLRAFGTRRWQHLLTLAGIALLIGNVAGQTARGLWQVLLGLGDDWLTVASASRALLDGARCLYCSGPLQTAAQSVVGHPLQRFPVFLDTPTAAVVAAPLAWLPYAASFAALSLLSIGALGVSWWLLVTRLGTPPLPTFIAIFALPAVAGISEGQWGPPLCLALTTALVLLRPRPLLGGAVLSLLMLKPQTIWLVPVILVIVGELRMTSGFVLGTAVQAGISALLAGPGVFAAWWQAANGVEQSQLPVTIGVSGLLAHIGIELMPMLLPMTGAIVAVALALRYRAALYRRPEVAVCLAAAGSFLLAPHIFPADLAVLMPGVALVARRRPTVAIVTAAACSVAALPNLSLTGTSPLVATLGSAVLLATTALFTVDLSAAPYPRVVANRRQHLESATS
jgi:hypothetical protein